MAIRQQTRDICQNKYIYWVVGGIGIKWHTPVSFHVTIDHRYKYRAKDMHPIIANGRDIGLPYTF